MDLIWTGVLIGIGATVAMDIWAFVLDRLGVAPRPNWGNVGRWFVGALRGRIFAGSIGDAPEVAGETAIGWLFHYAVGIVYGVVFLMIMGAAWQELPRLLPALIFAWATIAFGWFLLQPGMGLGWAASKTPDPSRARVLGLLAHTVFGLGLFWTAVLLA